MTYIHFIGIDVSKDSFEVAFSHAEEVDGSPSAKPRRFANSRQGFAEFLSLWDTEWSQTFVVLEATGGYEMGLLLALCDDRIAVHRLQPLQSSHYMRSLRMYAKTDMLDAMALARYGAERHAQLAVFKPDDASTHALKTLQTRREDLIAIRVAETQRLKHPLYKDLQDSLQVILSVVQAEINVIEIKMNAIVTKESSLAKKMEVLLAFKGIGSVTALVLLASLPEIGTLTRKQVASLAGLAPHPKDSGKYTGYRATKGGRSSLRKALFMAALSAKRYNPTLREFFDRLVKNGKKPIVALVAVMRKMIVIINAQIRDTLFAKT